VFGRDQVQQKASTPTVSRKNISELLKKDLSCCISVVISELVL